MRRFIPATVLLLIAAGCGDYSPTGGASGTPGISILAGQPASDTVDAELSLTVEVRGPDGEPQPGVQVTFTPVTGSGLYVAPEGRGFMVLLTTPADAEGRVRVRVKLWRAPGVAELRITAGEHAPVTAQYTVLPGAPARLVLVPEDSMLYVGGQYPLNGAVRDRYGNPLQGAVSFTAGNGHVSVAGGAVRGESVGRGFLVARSGSLEDTAWVSVVPRGVLAGTVRFGAEPGAKVIFNLDGSGYRVVRSGAGAGAPRLTGGVPAWTADGAELLYVSGRKIMATNGEGAVRVVHDGWGVLNEEQPLQASSDGWIYFDDDGAAGGQRTFWRVRPDGTGAAQVGQQLDWGLEGWASPSAAGDRVVYQSNRLTNSPTDFTLRIIHPASGAVTALDVPGTTPRWSPAGEWIAYRLDDSSNLLRLMRPDGTGVRPVGADLGAHAQFSWSPDGRWLAISGNQPRPGDVFNVGIFLVNVETGEQLPLRLSDEVVNPAWKP